MLPVIQAANLAARFLLELCALGALGYWGFQTGDGTFTRIGLGVGAPLLAAVVWAPLVSPNAPVRVALPIHLALQAVVFGSAAVALAAAGHPRLGVALAAAAVVNWALMTLWGQ